MFLVHVICYKFYLLIFVLFLLVFFNSNFHYEIKLENVEHMS